MIKIATIYKFHLPNTQTKYQKIKSLGFISNMKDFLIYEELFRGYSIQKYQNFEKHILSFQNGVLEGIIYFGDTYIIPLFECNLFFEKPDIFLQEKLFHKIYNIILTLGKNEYILDIDESLIAHREEDVFSLKDLEKNFRSLSFKKIESFLKNYTSFNRQEYFEDNSGVILYFYYLIYICFLFYKNAILSKKIIEELNELLEEDFLEIYKGNIHLTKKRVDFSLDINISHFKKYKKILDNFFELMR